MKRTGPGVAALAAAVSAAMASPAAGADSALTRVLPRAAAIDLALSAAPEHLRAGASVYVFTRDGYELARQGDNGFTCLNNRDAFFYDADALKPTCWDAAGRDSYVPVMLDVGAALAQGLPQEEIAADIEAGFAEGRYKSPDRLGVAYMLAGDVRVGADGRVTEQLFAGHYMFYAVDVANADLGLSGYPAAPFIFSGGAGGARLGYLIVMADDSAGPAED